MTDENKKAPQIGLFSVLVVVLLAIALRALFVMLAWNSVMPSLFDLPRVDFLHAIGLFITSSMLFGQLVPAKKEV